MGIFYCGIVVDIIYGVVLIVLGMYAEFDEVGYLGYSWIGFGMTLLIWATIKFTFNLGAKSSLCPRCSRKVSWEENESFTQGLCSRKASPCPGCQTVIINSKWPWRAISLSPLPLIAFSLLEAFNEHDNTLYPYFSCALFFIFAVLIEFGLATLRFEIVDQMEDRI